MSSHLSGLFSTFFWLHGNNLQSIDQIRSNLCRFFIDIHFNWSIIILYRIIDREEDSSRDSHGNRDEKRRAAMVIRAKKETLKRIWLKLSEGICEFINFHYKVEGKQNEAVQRNAMEDYAKIAINIKAEFIECKKYFFNSFKKLFTAWFDFLLNDWLRLVLAPVVVVRAHAWIVQQIDFLQVSERPEVHVNLMQFVVIERNNFQFVIALEEVTVDAFNAVVWSLETLEHRSMTQKVLRQSSNFVVVNEEVDQLVQVVESVFRNFLNLVLRQIQSLQLRHSREVVALDEFQPAVVDDVLEETGEENASVEARQVRNSAVLNPNVFDFFVRVSVLMLTRNRCDAHIRRVDNQILNLAAVKTTERDKCYESLSAHETLMKLTHNSSWTCTWVQCPSTAFPYRVWQSFGSNRRNVRHWWTPNAC